MTNFSVRFLRFIPDFNIERLCYGCILRGEVNKRRRGKWNYGIKTEIVINENCEKGVGKNFWGGKRELWIMFSVKFYIYTDLMRYIGVFAMCFLYTIVIVCIIYMSPRV